jgi:betaine lipid synthase
MSEYVDVPEFFSSVYLVDFSPSLCEVARKRFTRLGWSNVKVVCQDARTFRLEDHESDMSGAVASRSPSSYYSENNSVGGADLITLSYSLSMIVSVCLLYGQPILTQNSLTSILLSTHSLLSFRQPVQLELLISTFSRTWT